MKNVFKNFILLLCAVPLLAAFKCCNCPDKSNSTAPAEKAEKNVTPENNSSDLDSKENLITTITSEEEFNQLIEQPTIVKFTASWCGACKVIEPLYQQIAHELDGKYQFARVDVDALPDLANKYSIRGMPTFLFFDKGDKLEGQIIGASVNHESFIHKITTVFEE